MAAAPRNPLATTEGTECITTSTESLEPCSIEAAVDVLGDRWTMLILRDAFRGVRRFDDFREDLGIARPVLTDRLKKLISAGVFKKVQYCEHPPRYEYRLTRAGIELSPALVSLMRWGDRWRNNSNAPTVLVHEECGTEFQHRFWCEYCHSALSPTEIISTSQQRDADPLARAKATAITP